MILIDSITNLFLDYYIVFPLVFLAGFIDAIAGGGGLISLPAYFISGLPSHIAIGTNKMSSSIGTTLATYKLHRSGCINWKFAVIPILFSLTGAFLGSKLNLLVSDHLFKILLIFILPLTMLFVMKTKSFSDNKPSYPIMKKAVICSIVAFLLGIYDGFYGPGTGTFLLLLLTVVAHLKLSEANGLTKAINLTSNITSLVVFLAHGQVLIFLGIVAGIFNLVGNYIGISFFVNKGQKIVKPVMIFVLIIFIIKVAI